MSTVFASILVALVLGVLTAAIGIAVGWLGSSPPPTWFTRRRLVGAILVAVIVGAIVPAVGTLASVGSSGNSPPTGPPTTLPTTKTTTDVPPATTSTTIPPQTDGPSVTPSPDQPLLLSTLNPVDYDHDAGQAEWVRDARSINGTQFGHSISMNAGCQNGDGGDFWLDFTVGGNWRTFTAMVGINDKSSSQSKATAKLIDPSSGKILQEQAVAAGPARRISANVEGRARLRLFINDPNSPHQSCGFEKISTAVVWGDATLSL